jgi:hypothetical protein
MSRTVPPTGDSTRTGDPPVMPDRASLAGFLEDAALLAGDAAVRERPAAALAAHREHLHAWYRDVVGALVVPPALIKELLAALDGEDHGLRVVLATGATGVEAPLAIARLRLARDTILDDSRLELVGIEVPLPLGGLFDVQGVEATTAALLAALDFSAPARIDLGADGSREAQALQALEIIARDAAEEIALPPTAPVALLQRSRELGLIVHGSASATVDGLEGDLQDGAGRLVSRAVPSIGVAVEAMVAAGLLDPADEG